LLQGNIEPNFSNPSRDRYPSQHDNYQEADDGGAMKICGGAVARLVMSGLLVAFAAMSIQGAGTLEEHPNMTKGCPGKERRAGIINQVELRA
jgi:hypothetical protein